MEKELSLVEVAPDSVRFATKRCPVCGQMLFADMDVCYGCLYDFRKKPTLPTGFPPMLLEEGNDLGLMAAAPRPRGKEPTFDDPADARAAVERLVAGGGSLGVSGSLLTKGMPRDTPAQDSGGSGPQGGRATQVGGSRVVAPRESAATAAREMSTSAHRDAPTPRDVLAPRDALVPREPLVLSEPPMPRDAPAPREAPVPQRIDVREPRAGVQLVPTQDDPPEPSSAASRGGRGELPPAEVATELVEDPRGGGYRLRLQTSEAEADVDIGPRGLLIGRASTCDIVLHSRSVSRRHLRVSKSGNEVIVEDQGATNPALVEGRQLVGRQRLAPGATIELSGVLLTLRVPER